MTAHALTIDLEDWQQLMCRRVSGRTPPASDQVVAQTTTLLDFLEETGTRATFFVLGMVAERHPGLVREVARRGHEIGSHSHSHRLVLTQAAEEFRSEIRRSREQLQELSGQPVIGFRAPEFSVGQPGHWCFEALREAGFLYDSSVFPLASARYGIAGAATRPFDIATSLGPLREFPLATWDVRGVRLPVAGGTYYRFAPLGLLRAALSALQKEGRPAVLYFHPYEFHCGWLHTQGLSWRERVRLSNLKYTLLHNVGTGRIRHCLRSLLAQFRFAPLGELYAAPEAPPDAAVE